MDHRTRLVPIMTTIDGPCALDIANAGGEVFILVFDVPHQSALLSLGIAIAVREVTPALLRKKEKNSKITHGRSRSLQKNAR